MASIDAYENPTKFCYFGRPVKFNNMRDAKGELLVSQEACPGVAPGGKSTVFGPGDEVLDRHGVFSMLAQNGNSQQVLCYGPHKEVDQELIDLRVPEGSIVREKWAQIDHPAIPLKTPVLVKDKDGKETSITEIPAAKGVVFTGVHRIIRNVSQRYKGVDLTSSDRLAAAKVLKDQEEQLAVKDREAEILKKKVAELEEKLGKETNLNKRAASNAAR